MKPDVKKKLSANPSKIKDLRFENARIKEIHLNLRNLKKLNF